MGVCSSVDPVVISSDIFNLEQSIASGDIERILSNIIIVYQHYELYSKQDKIKADQLIISSKLTPRK